MIVPDPWGFTRTPRQNTARRPVDVRIRDWSEVYEPADAGAVRDQAGRCMDCGVPFCHSGCPLGNLIPEWNDLVWRDDWEVASQRLHATNNFPEFTGRLCPAPCEPACVLAINPELSGGPVAIKTVEQAIADRALAAGWTPPQVPDRQTGRRVAVVGSGPAGLAAAQQLTRAGHSVAVYERDDKLGGLLRYGIPDFKMDKALIDARVAQMRAEGTVFRTNTAVGGGGIPAATLRRRYDAVLLAGGALRGRELPIPGRELLGIHQAMTYLTQSNRAVDAGTGAPIDARGKRVVIIGGGDTAADCLGTAHRQGAASVVQLDLHPEPPPTPHASTPWPTWPLLYRESAAHEEGGERRFAVSTLRFLGGGDPTAAGLGGSGADGWSDAHPDASTDPDASTASDDVGRDAGDIAEAVSGIEVAELLEADEAGRSVRSGATGQPFTIAADLILLAIGFAGPDVADLFDGLGVVRDDAGRVQRAGDYSTAAPGVFVAGDAGRGASLVVWAIAEGRAAAAAIDAHLEGSTVLPAPVAADAVALT